MSDREKSYVLAGQLGHIVAYLTLVNQTNKQTNNTLLSWKISITETEVVKYYLSILRDDHVQVKTAVQDSKYYKERKRSY